MARSMTGFTQHLAKIGGAPWTLEIKSVNHRFLELSVRTPNFLSAYENDIRKLAGDEISRGKVYFSIKSENAVRDRLSLNREHLELLLKTLKKAKRDFGLKGEIELSDLLGVNGLFSTEEKAAFSRGDWTTLKKEIKNALSKVVQLKIKEGKALEQDICGRIIHIKKCLSEIEKQKTKANATHSERLRKRVDQMLEDVKLDEDRLMKEVAISLERLDITEEIVRLKAHLKLFLNFLRTKELCGKDLDFVLQEMNRETNTITSKVQNSNISHKAIAIKSEIEKIREQVQNIE